MKSQKTLVVIQTAFLGDIVLTTAFLRQLRRNYPEARLIFVTTPLGVELLQNNPWGLELWPFAKRSVDSGFGGLWRLGKKLRAAQIDRLFCLHRSARSTALSFLARAKETFGFSESSLAFLLDKTTARQDGLFEAQKNDSLLRLAGEVSDLSLFPELHVSEHDLARAENLVGKGKKIAVIAPSSVWATKRWPSQRFAEVAVWLRREKRLEIVLVGSKEAVDQACGQEFAEEWNKRSPEQFLNLVGATNLGELSAILGMAEIVLCNDSGPLHMAIGRGTKVAAIFGSTTKSLGFFPLAKEGKSIVIEQEGLSCRPCGLHGHQVCPKQHFRCMLDISSARVIDSLDKFL